MEASSLNFLVSRSWCKSLESFVQRYGSMMVMARELMGTVRMAEMVERMITFSPVLYNCSSS